MNEQLHTYGIERNLTGIATIQDNINRQSPAIILLNAGVIHKVGPFDFNISFARKLSSEDYLVFRFDISGLGDSDKIKDGTTYNEVVMNDLKQTMTFIEEKYDVNKFVVIGLCTGADHAHKIACQDSRVVGNVWLDGYGYPTTKYKLIRYAPVFLNPKRFVNALKKYFSTSNKDVLSTKGVDDYVWELPSKDQYINDMKLLYERDVKCLYIYSGGVTSYFNYRQQFEDSFKGCHFLKNIEVTYYPEFDHTFILLKDRMRMIKRVSEWLNKNSFI